MLRISRQAPSARRSLSERLVGGQQRYLATLTNTPTARPMLLEDYSDSQKAQLPTFTISKARGFLPLLDPLPVLPSQFAPVESLLQRMTIKQDNGTKGLLGLGQFGEAVKHELKDVNMIKHVREVIKSGNQNLISALFRDYCFLTSAYLLEPVDQHFRATGSYTTGRTVLPESLAVPIKELADCLGHYPFMEYASSYALQNYRRVVREGPNNTLGHPAEWETDNLRVIRAFEDADGSEAGFILVHVSMVAFTGRCVTHTEAALEAANAGDHKGFCAAMEKLYETYLKINETMDTMWSWSRPVDYLKFRSFIFGTGPAKMNSMFPEGVIYEGVSETPQFFRGESGANDSIVPLADNLLEITARLPKNELTATLREFRSYRPSSQRIYLEALEKRATEAKIVEFARRNDESLARYILMVDQVRAIRNLHWSFTKEYIIKRSDYAIATGGSPILQYLPSNLKATLTVLSDACTLLPPSLTSRLHANLGREVEACRERAEVQARVLEKDLERLRMGARAGIDDKRVLRRGAVGCDGVG